MHLAHPGVCSIELLYSTTQGPLCENTLFFVNAGLAEFTSGQIIAMMEAAESNWTVDIGGNITPLVSLTGIRGQSLHSLPHGPVLELILDVPIEGGLAGGAFPFGVCGVVQFIGSPGERPRRSYVRHLGIGESQAEGNVINNAARTTLASNWQNYCEDIRDAGPVGTLHAILSEQLDGVPSAASNNVESYQMRAALGRAASRSGTHT